MRHSTLAFSNLGGLGEEPVGGHASLEEVSFFSSPSTVELAVLAATVQGRLTLNLSYAEPLMTRDRAARFLRFLEEEVENSLGGS